jgi:hypothetical protein
MWDLFDKLLVCFKTEKKEEMIRNDKKWEVILISANRWENKK